MLEVHLLGQFQIQKDQEEVDIPSRPAQSLLAYLMLNVGIAHRREKLAGFFWPDASESNARSNLRHALWRLRKAIGEEYIQADKITIAFEAESDYWLDVEAFSRENAKGGTTEDLLKEVSLYGGELLPGFYDDWVVLERERIRALFEQQVQALLKRLIEEERWPEVLEWAERWIATGTTPEPAYRALMFAHAGLGDTAGMAAAYQRCKKALLTELGVKPSEETKATYEWLLEGGLPSAPQWARVAQPPQLDASTAIHNLLLHWRERGEDILDVASLAIVQASPGDQPFDDEDAGLLIRSALHHAVEVTPWLERAKSREVAVGALMEVYDSYPRPRMRKRIVDALKGLDSQEAGDALLRIASSDDAANVRSEAAVAAAERGRLDEVAEALRSEVSTGSGPVAMTALVAVADEVGLPEDLGPYPKLPFRILFLQRRWQANKNKIFRQSVLAALGAGLLAALNGLFTPYYLAAMAPEDFRATLQTLSITDRMLSGAIGFLIIGALQGGATGFLIGLADSAFKGKRQGKWRLALGSFSGLIYAGLLLLTALRAIDKPATEPSIYVPGFILYGLALGAVLTLVIPRLEASIDPGQWYTRAAVAGIAGALVTLPIGVFMEVESAVGPFFRMMTFALVLPIGIALALKIGQSKGDALEE
jgi:DNA-binding SARP family transcriptional activator